MRNLLEGLKGVLGLSSFKHEQVYGLGRNQIDPAISDLIGVFRQASGIIYSTKAILNPYPAQPTLVAGSTFNPLGATANFTIGTDGLFQLDIESLPEDMDISEPKIIAKVYLQHQDLLTHNIRIVASISESNNTTKVIGIQLETFLLSAINTLAHPTAAAEVYIEISHI